MSAFQLFSFSAFSPTSAVKKQLVRALHGSPYPRPSAFICG
jgi:hypothetical protein